MKIILASASPRRRELLSNLFTSFEVVTAHSEEQAEFHTPEQYVCELALQKAGAVASLPEYRADCRQDTEQSCLILSADTIVYHQGNVLGKPHSAEEARKMLRSLSGMTHEVYTGVCIWLPSGSETEKHTFAECTKVHVKPLSDSEIESYIASGEPFDKAGAYGIQGIFSRHVSGIDGDYFNVVGLPLSHLYEELKNLNILS
jgi:septum formation protein